jgi:hypothetical protein
VNTKYSSSKHQQTKRKLQVNQARKIDKHPVSKSSINQSKRYDVKKPTKAYYASSKSNRSIKGNKAEPYKNSNWNKPSKNQKQYVKQTNTHVKAQNYSKNSSKNSGKQNRPAKHYKAKSSSQHKQVARVRNSPSKSTHRSQHKKRN